MADPCDERTAL